MNIYSMSYNPEIHHRRSIRLKGYDYSQEGLYFITICVHDRECLFGDIEPSRQMILNDAGKMVERWYCELENKYPDKRCHEMVIMPNHFHCIIENMETGNNVETGDIIETGTHVGAPLRGRPIDINIVPPDDINVVPPIDINIVPPDDINVMRPNNINVVHFNDIDHGELNNGKYGLHNKKYNAAIGILVDWFKTMTTNEYIRGVKQYGWKRFDGKLWQRNYYEHIIRSTDGYERITNYIIDNPANWHEDKFFK